MDWFETQTALAAFEAGNTMSDLQDILHGGETLALFFLGLALFFIGFAMDPGPSVASIRSRVRVGSSVVMVAGMVIAAAPFLFSGFSQ